MSEVESYVEHIRHLSDEREALIQELETENDQLKQDIERFRQEQNGMCLSAAISSYNKKVVCFH